MKKLLYFLCLLLTVFSFYSCSKLKAQEPTDQESKNPVAYIIVSAYTMPALQKAVTAKMVAGYKPTGGPFMFHESGLGSEHYGQALYKN